MFETRGKNKVSLKTRLWVVAVKLFSGTTKPLLYSYQGSLPRLPLPSVHDTMQRVSHRVIFWNKDVRSSCEAICFFFLVLVLTQRPSLIKRWKLRTNEANGEGIRRRNCRQITEIFNFEILVNCLFFFSNSIWILKLIFFFLFSLFQGLLQITYLTGGKNTFIYAVDRRLLWILISTELTRFH